jgi:diadenosine tetraphosphate (Ap4A) HIT family hydrolase
MQADLSPTFETKYAGCLFCNLTAEPLWRGESLYLLLDIAPIVEGHALICSNEHYPSSGDLPADVAPELDAVAEWFFGHYVEEYGAFTLFEHGRTGQCVRHRPEERACNHMHVHVLPLRENFVPRLALGQRTLWTTWTDVAELARDVEGYAVVETPAEGRSFFPVNHSLAPHYLRTQAAASIGHPDLGDWETRAAQPMSAVLVERARQRLGARIARTKPKVTA